jgi:hypothetical protein
MSIDWVGDDADSAINYDITWTLRHFEPIPKIMARRDGHLWSVLDAETADKQRAEAGRCYKPSEILECLSADGMLDNQWYGAVRLKYRAISYNSYNDIKKTLLSDGRVKQPKKRGTYFPASALIQGDFSANRSVSYYYCTIDIEVQ